MNKKDLKYGMFLQTKSKRYFFVDRMKNGDLCLRFRDGTNDIVELNQFDDKMICLFGDWTIEKIDNRNIVPPLCDLPEKFIVKNINNNKKYVAYSKMKNKINFADKKDRKIIRTKYCFNSEVTPNSGYSRDAEGNIISDWFNEVRDYYYIKQFGKMIEIQEGDIVLISEKDKLVVSYNYLLNNFNMENNIGI